MRVLQTPIVPPMNPNPGLRLPQQRVLMVLGRCTGAISRIEISSRSGLSRVTVGGAIGYADPVKRKEYERQTGIISMITLGMVEERELDIDGTKELVLSLTPKGRAEYERIKGFELPPIHGTD